MPFDGETVTAIAAAITVDRPRSLRSYRSDVPPALESVILACLEKDREARTPSLAALAQSLEPFGGRNASVLVARILDAQPSAPVQSFGSLPSIPKELALLPISPAATVSEIAVTRPSWSTGDDAEPPTLKRRPTRRLPIVLAAVGVLALGGLALGIAVSRTRTTVHETGAAATATSDVAASMTAPASATPASTPTTESAASAEPQPSLQVTPRSVGTKSTPSTGKSSPKKAEPPARKVKKPLVTHL